MGSATTQGRPATRVSAAGRNRFLADFQERLQKFGLELHPDKTRRIEFGKFAEQNRNQRGEVFGGLTKVPGKIVSLFEPYTEIIRKGKAGKPNEFGKLVQLQEAESQIITHYEVYEERMSDQRLLVPAVEAHRRKLGRVPRLVAADAGYYSHANEEAVQEMVWIMCRFPTGTRGVRRGASCKSGDGSREAKRGGRDARAGSAP